MFEYYLSKVLNIERKTWIVELGQLMINNNLQVFRYHHRYMKILTFK